MHSTLGRHVARFIADDGGQDIIEYALLCAFIGVTGIAAWKAIETTLGTAYGTYDTGQQKLWDPPDPIVTPPTP